MPVSNTEVELGGVLLGGQYHDPQGRPFVLVTDSLRAQHYESTKGSFKFTHDTWQEITRQRDQFGPDVQMVGWYHTHPGWGVFLSGMDLFICEHFFNRPLDVALVIDPCRDERGLFQWSDDQPRRVRQTSGFYLVASRFRESELEECSILLEGRTAVSHDPRLRSYSRAGAPIVITDGTHAWQWIALSGSLAIQLGILAILAWRVLSPTNPPVPREVVQQLAATEQALTALADVRRRDADIDAKLEVLDAVVAKVPGGQPDLVNSLVEKTEQLAELQANLRGRRALETELDRRVAAMQTDLQTAQTQSEKLAYEIERLQKSLANLQQVSDRQRARIVELQGRDAAEEDAGQKDSTTQDPDPLEMGRSLAWGRGSVPRHRWFGGGDAPATQEAGDG